MTIAKLNPDTGVSHRRSRNHTTRSSGSEIWSNSHRKVVVRNTQLCTTKWYTMLLVLCLPTAKQQAKSIFTVVDFRMNLRSMFPPFFLAMDCEAWAGMEHTYSSYFINRMYLEISSMDFGIPFLKLIWPETLSTILRSF